MPRYMIRDKKITIELKKKQIVIKEEIMNLRKNIIIIFDKTLELID